MSNCSTAQTNLLAAITNQRPDHPVDDYGIAGFDFGIPRGEWSNANTYICQPSIGVGAILFRLPAYGGRINPVRKWNLSFFPVLDQTLPIKQAYVDDTLRRLDGKEKRQPVFYQNLTDILVIMSLINHHTFGAPKHDSLTDQDAQPQRPTW